MPGAVTSLRGFALAQRRESGASGVASDVAVVLCADHNFAPTILGLTVGERVLLALRYSGIRRVLFAGPGTQPECARAALEPIALADIDPEAAVWVTTSDAVFDRSLITEPKNEASDEIDDDPAEREREDRDDGSTELPLRLVTGAEVAERIAAPEDWLARFGQGRATSGQGFAIRVRDNDSARAARRALLRSLRKPIDGLISRYLNRYISIAVSTVLVRTGVAPNLLTVLFTLMGLIGGILVAFPEHWWALVIGALLFQGQSILDGCDGEIARLTYRFSPYGEWLDSIGDDLTNYAFCLCLAVGQARVRDLPEMYLAGGTILVMQLIATALIYTRMFRAGSGSKLAVPYTVHGESAFSAFLLFLRVITRRDFFVFVIAVFAAVQLPLIAFGLYSLGTVGVLIGVTANELRLRRQAREATADTTADSTAGESR